MAQPQRDWEQSVDALHRIERVDVTRLARENPGYQRDLKPPHLAYLIREWEPDVVGVFIVNRRRDGSYQLVDGQHRLAAMEHFGIKTCLVYVARRDEEEEATLWLKASHSLPVTALERYRALLFAGDFEAHDLKRIVEEAGFGITKAAGQRKRGGSNSPTELVAISELYRSYRAGVLQETLEIVKECWPRDSEAASGYVIGGVSMLVRWVRTNRFPFQKPSAIQRWGEQSIKEIVGLARKEAQVSRKRTVGRDNESFSDALVEIYNYKRQQRNLLPFSIERVSAARMMRHGMPQSGG